MPMKFGKMSRTLLASAALVAASFSGAASAQTFDPVCVQYFKNYCAANWQSQGFASFSECWETYKLAACQYEYY